MDHKFKSKIVEFNFTDTILCQKFIFLLIDTNRSLSKQCIHNLLAKEYKGNFNLTFFKSGNISNKLMKSLLLDYQNEIEQTK